MDSLRLRLLFASLLLTAMPAVSPAQTPAPQVATQGTLPPNSQAAIDQQRDLVYMQQEAEGVGVRVRRQ